MSENEKTGCLYSWPVIILVLCCCWPVGVFLIIKRVSRDKKNATCVENDANIVPANTQAALPKMVTCPCCGANNTILGDAGECEFCGSQLS